MRLFVSEKRIIPDTPKESGSQSKLRIIQPTKCKLKRGFVFLPQVK